jgi:hypothetical protein
VGAKARALHSMSAWAAGRQHAARLAMRDWPTASHRGTCQCSRLSPLRAHLHTRQTSGTPGTVRAQWPCASNGQRSDWNPSVGSDGMVVLVAVTVLAMIAQVSEWGLTLVAVTVLVTTTAHRNSCASSPTSLLLSDHSGPLSPALAPPWSSPSTATIRYRGAVNQLPGWHMGSKQRAHVIGTRSLERGNGMPVCMGARPHFEMQI